MVLEMLWKDTSYGSEIFRPGATALFLEGRRGRLFSLLYTAGGAGVHPTVLLLHGFPGTEQNLDLAQGLRRVGFHVLTMHYSGSWGSDGAFSFANVLEDACTAFSFLEREEIQKTYGIDPKNLFVVGHSMGGFTMFHTLASMMHAKAGVALAPYNFGRMAVLAKEDPQAQQDLEGLLAEGAPWLAGTDPERLKAELEVHGERYQVSNLAETLAGKPLLVIGAGLDDCALTQVHCVPLVEQLRGYQKGLTEYEVMETDHCFSDLRLTMEARVTEWLIKQVNGK